MIINSDFHIHTECSYDASNPLKLVTERERTQGLSGVGITDHLNFNDEEFVGDLMRSRESVSALPVEEASFVCEICRERLHYPIRFSALVSIPTIKN